MQSSMQSSWIKLQADDYEATISLRTVLNHAGSQLATLVELEQMQQQQACTGNPVTVRLDCSGEVVREVVAVLRQGSSYDAPTDNPRLLKALQHQLDFLGISAPSIPNSNDRQEVVLVPSYWYMGLNYAVDPNVDMLSAGLLMFSGSAGGWANRTGSHDPRPVDVRGCDHPHSGGGCWLASALKAESTGAGEDLVYLVPNKIFPPQRYGDSAVVLHGSDLTCSRVTMPPVHKRMSFSDSAMAAAQGKLYLLGGSCHLEVAPFTPFEVYDPHLDSWFSASSPVQGPVSLSEHALVSNQQEGMLLTLGGSLTSGDRRHRQSRMNDQVAMFDLKAGRWSANPSGCKWPGAATSYSMSAVAVDPYTIMVLSMDHGGQAVSNELLDLRTWQWRPATSLQQQGQGRRPASATADEEDCLLNMGLVLYDGQVLAVGGRHYWKDGEWATSKVHAYNVAADSWSELQELPFPICHASPVAVRVSSMMSGYAT